MVVGDEVQAPPAEGVSETARGPGRRRKRRKVRALEVDEDPENEPDPVPDKEDDCAVYGDEDCDAVDDAVGGDDVDAGVETQVDVAAGEGNDDNGGVDATSGGVDATGGGVDATGGGDSDDDAAAVEEDMNFNISEDFPEAVRGDEAASDSDSGDDIWDEDKIPDPLSSDDEDEDKAREEEAGRGSDDPEVLLELEKTYNSPEDFKLALLMYSLKTR
ncbi:unnamed protein product [Arabidopsis arenosa]|uniref:Uncharacterized protein n=1 Tax=Arabidopsis arenosa TaxID=38785 RepID=A0A8S2ARN8_ARAAE|nr:unnamed protein product [Arabidopsis arenosa]